MVGANVSRWSGLASAQRKFIIIWGTNPMFTVHITFWIPLIPISRFNVPNRQHVEREWSGNISLWGKGTWKVSGKGLGTIRTSDVPGVLPSLLFSLYRHPCGDPKQPLCTNSLPYPLNLQPSPDHFSDMATIPSKPPLLQTPLSYLNS